MSSTSPAPWSWIASGAALVGYGCFFLEDLGSLGYGVIALGLLTAISGAAVHARVLAWREREPLPPVHESPEQILSRNRRSFRIALVSMSALGAFSLWRVQMTVWRPRPERYYFFSADSWIGRLEHSWFNDALYAFGMVGLLYVLYILKEFIGGRTERERESLLLPEASALTEERWSEHQERSKLMLGTGIVIILIWAWLEEIGDLVPGYVFDKWDLNAIYLGFILGYSMMRMLPYPVFAASPSVPQSFVTRQGRLEHGVRAVYAALVWAYTSLMDPSSYAERWAHVAELSAIILGSMYLIDLARSRRPDSPSSLA